MNSTVLITSALHTNYGVYNTEQRIQQTIDTVNSVRKYVPNSTIILIDNSTVAVQEDTSELITELDGLVDYWIDNSDDADIKYFHENVSNYDVGKNMMECLSMYKTISYIKSDPELSDVINQSSRVYKISGRYEITDKFDINAFDNETTKGMFVFKKASPSWIDPKVTGVTTQLSTRLWSFDSTLLEEVHQMFLTILKNMGDTSEKGNYIDIEHSMAKFVPANKLVELDVVGVKGNIAPNGALVIE
jgi:hypothetical protein